LSLRDQFREGLYDAEQKPRLNYARNYFLEFSLDKDIDFKELEEFYNNWRNYVEYLVLQRQTDSVRVKGEIERETIAVKCAKRGNDVYWWRVWKRLKFLRSLKNYTLFDPHASMKLSNVLFASLTYDIGRSTIREAWETVGDAFNKWIRNLRKKYGRISYLRCWEATGKGYSHIHALMIFHDYQFKIAFSQLKRTKYGSYRRVYRIVEKVEFEKSYHSFVDVEAVRKMREGISYITKYLRKDGHPLQTLTLALCWLFRKRSFAVSGDFHELLYAMIDMKHRLIQTDLFGNEVEFKVVWVFIGIFPADKLGITRNEWRKTITDRELLNKILT
jgi:hypothetical protein